MIEKIKEHKLELFLFCFYFVVGLLIRGLIF